MNETDDNLYNRPNLNWWEEIGQQHVPAHYVLWDVIHTRAIEIDLPVAYIDLDLKHDYYPGMQIYCHEMNGERMMARGSELNCDLQF